MDDERSFLPDSSAEQALRLIDGDRARLVARVRFPHWYYLALMGNAMFLDLLAWSEFSVLPSVFGRSKTVWACSFFAAFAIALAWLFCNALRVRRECGLMVRDRHRLRRMTGRAWMCLTGATAVCWGGCALMMAAGLQGVPLLWMLPVVAASAGGFAYLMRLFEDELLRDMVGRNLQ